MFFYIKYWHKKTKMDINNLGLQIMQDVASPLINSIHFGRDFYE